MLAKRALRQWSRLDEKAPLIQSGAAADVVTSSCGVGGAAASDKAESKTESTDELMLHLQSAVPPFNRCLLRIEQSSTAADVFAMHGVLLATTAGTLHPTMKPDPQVVYTAFPCEPVFTHWNV